MSDQPGAQQPQLNLPDISQGGPQLALMLERDLKSMHIRIGQDGKLLAGIVMDTGNLDGLIENLRQIRERMLPAPPPKPASVEPASAQTAPTQRAPSEPLPPIASAPAEPPPTEFSPGIAREIKGTHYDFGISDTGQQLIFSVRDEDLGWLSFRFGGRLLERMLRVVNSAKTRPAVASKG